MRVLVVEDDPIHQMMVHKLLNMTLKRAEIIICKDPYEAYATLAGLGGDIGFMILDHRMPYGTGASLLQKMRDTPALENIPVVIMTGENLPEEDFIELGANAYFGKPFDPSDFRKVIEEMGISK